VSDSLYFQVVNCQLYGRACVFLKRQNKGEFEGHGKGVMKYRVCNKCQTVEYDEFTNEKGEVTWTRPKGI